MARPQKQGIEYFSLDVVLDDKFELFEAEFGLQGFGFIIKLLQKIYESNGYYYKWSDDEKLLFSKRLGVSMNLIDDYINCALKRDIISKNMYEKYSILTSKGIQKRYLEAIRRRKGIEMIKEYLLLDIEKDAEYKDLTNIITFVSNNEENVDINANDNINQNVAANPQNIDMKSQNVNINPQNVDINKKYDDITTQNVNIPQPNTNITIEETETTPSNNTMEVVVTYPTIDIILPINEIVHKNTDSIQSNVEIASQNEDVEVQDTDVIFQNKDITAEDTDITPINEDITKQEVEVNTQSTNVAIQEVAITSENTNIAMQDFESNAESINITEQDVDISSQNTADNSQKKVRKRKSKERTESTEKINKKFEEFWNLYPRKMKKQKVLEWFERNEPPDELFNVIIDSLKCFINSYEWKNNNGMYIPHPTTWLNQKRWEDIRLEERDVIGVNKEIHNQYDEQKGITL